MTSLRPRAIRRAAGIAVLSALLAAPFSIASAEAADTAAPITYQGAYFGTSAERVTQDKPQSKLWHHDGSWWALMLSGASSKIHIHELLDDHTWRDTGVVVDDRPTSSGDALWAHGVLHVVSRVSSGGLRAARFTYDSATRTFVASGSPVQIASGGSESVTIDQDTTGRLWATYTQGSRVWVTHTTTNDTTWVVPFNPPVPDTTVAADDISGVIAFNGRIGVFWSDQGNDVFRMAIHQDTAPLDAWTVEAAMDGPNLADDHLNLKKLGTDDEGRVFAVVKTSQGDGGEPASSPLIVLLTRRLDGSWSRSTVATLGDKWTRPQLVIDESAERLYVLATMPEGGGDIHYKSAPIANPTFTAGRGDIFMTWPGAKLNNITAAKEPVTAATGLVALASDEFAHRYYHAELALGPPPPGGDTTAPSVPTGVSATAVSSDRIDVTWNASSDDTGVTSYTVYRDGAAAATVTGTSYTDTGRTGGQTYVYTVDALDAAGNRSAASPPASATTPEDEPGTGADIAFRSATFAGNLTATTLTITTPAGVQAGDLLVATVDARGAPTITAPAGWTQVRADNLATTMKKVTWWRVATSTEPTAHTFTLSKAQAAAGGIAAYTGVDTTNPIAGHAGQTNASSTTITAPSLTTTAATMLVSLFGTATDATITPDHPDTTAIGQAIGDGKYRVTSAGGTQALPTATTTGTRTATATRGAANIGQSLTLRAAP